MKAIIVTIIFCLFSATLFAQKGLPIGAKAPDFTAPDQNGQKVNLKSKLAEGNVVVIFYRGNWCPNCSRELKSLQDSLAILEQRHTTVIAIGPETAEGVHKTVEKAGATFSVLHDDGLNIMKRYDVVFAVTPDMDAIHTKYGIDVAANNGANGNKLQRPSAFIINKKGIIVWRYFNDAPYADPTSSNRVSVSDILKHLKG